jgi:hypothetical protein
MNKTHQNNQAQIQGLYNQTQTSLNSLLASQKSTEKPKKDTAMKLH